jgi:thioredoxin-like negative regulator of GroEL
MVSETITNVDNKNLETLKNKIRHNGAIILYHWNSCGHCNRLMPIWEDLTHRFGDRQFYQIELNYMQQAPHEFGHINSFPHITAYKTNGEKTSYNGSRDIESLSEFIKTKSNPIPSKSALSKKKSTSKPVTLTKKSLLKKK